MFIKDPQYQLYEDNALQLIKTMVVKIDAWGAKINTYVESLTGTLVPTENKQVWKYYMNLAGNYHAIDKDMYVDSHDAEEVIPFTVASLAENPVTKAAYRYGTVYYNELITKYPNQILLINGIINPIDISVAINANDGDILIYDTTLVESQEYDLIDRLQEITSFFFTRWYNSLYSYSNSGYLTTFSMELNALLLVTLMNLRFRNIFTNQAHTFYVKQYLISKGLAANDVSYLDTYQLFKLYKNIDYYLANAGQSAVFDELKDVLLTHSNIDIYEYRLHHKTNELSRSSVSDISNLVPVISFDKVNASTGAVVNTVTLDNINTIMLDSAPDNQNYISMNRANVERNLTYTPYTEYETKLLEVELPISVINYNRPLNEILLTEWINLVTLDSYNVPVEVILPGSSLPIRMTHAQALALWYYAILMAFNSYTVAELNMLEVPQLHVKNAIPRTLIPLTDLYTKFNRTIFNNDALIVARSSMITMPVITSQVEFYAYCKNIYSLENKFLTLVLSQRTKTSYALLKTAIRYQYLDTYRPIPGYFVSSSPYQGVTWKVILNELGLNLDTYQKDDFINMASNIFIAATGASLTDGMEEVYTQEALVNILKTLASYTIEIVNETVSSSPINYSSTPSFFDVETSFDKKVFLELPDANANFGLKITNVSNIVNSDTIITECSMSNEIMFNHSNSASNVLNQNFIINIPCKSTMSFKGA